MSGIPGVGSAHCESKSGVHEVSAWLASHPQVAKRRYTERRRLFLEVRTAKHCRAKPSAYHNSRATLLQHLGRDRDEGGSTLLLGANAAGAVDNSSSPARPTRQCNDANHDETFGHADGAKRSLFAGIHGVFQVGNDAVTALAFAPHELARMMAVGSRVGEVWLMAIDSSGESTHCAGGHTAAVEQLSFSAESQYLASGGEDKMVRVWRADSGCCLREFSVAVAVCAAAFHPINTNMILVGDVACGLTCMSITGGDSTAARATLAVGEVVSAVFGHTGAYVFAATRVGTLEVLQLQASKNWELQLWRSYQIPSSCGSTGRSAGLVAGLFGRGARHGGRGGENDLIEPIPHGLVYTAWLGEFGSPALLVPCVDRAIRIFAWWGTEGDPSTQASWVDRLLDVKGSDSLVCRVVFRLPTIGVRRSPGPAAFCGKDASHAVCGGSDGTLSFVGLKKLRETERLVAHSQRVTALRVRLAGDLLASADSSGCVMLWGAAPPSEAVGAARARQSSRYDSVAE